MLLAYTSKHKANTQHTLHTTTHPRRHTRTHITYLTRQCQHTPWKYTHIHAHVTYLTRKCRKRQGHNTSRKRTSTMADNVNQQEFTFTCSHCRKKVPVPEEQYKEWHNKTQIMGMRKGDVKCPHCDRFFYPGDNYCSLM
eukprot:CFRG8653